MIDRRDNTIQWENVPNFSSGEFSEDPDIYAYKHLIYSLQLARSELKVPVYPSPAPGALARTDERARRSMHYCNPEEGLFSRAVDFFVEGNPVKALFVLLGGGHFTRLGMYFDTFYDGKPWVMFHGDKYPDYSQHGFIWYRDENGVYHYPHKTGFGNFAAYLYGYRHEDYKKNAKPNTLNV